jgi:hypothetical protein
MAPLLIGKPGLFKLGLAAALFTGFSFAGGFVLGYQKAEVNYSAASERKPLSLPALKDDSDRNTEQQIPDTVEAGMYIDVDQPEKSSTGMPVAVDSSSILDSGDNAVAKPVVANEGNETIKYSIQVGVFGNILNAQNMQKKLQQLDAYITEDFHKDDKVRYNVRLGYFIDKKSAIAALHDYRNNKNGDGYLVNFSSRNIPGFTGSTLNDHSGYQVNTQNSSNKNIQDKVSQAGIIKALPTETSHMNQTQLN